MIQSGHSRALRARRQMRGEAGAMMFSNKGDIENEPHRIRLHPRTVPPVLPDVVPSRPRALGPRPHEGQEPEGPDFVELVARLARLLVPAHDPRLKAPGPGPRRRR